jgi:hypothetical protein
VRCLPQDAFLEHELALSEIPNDLVDAMRANPPHSAICWDVCLLGIFPIAWKA